jgi:hypothetical protein
MAKKQEATGAPKVTNLPLPISDTPLVIDLPDGQKIVIGKMQAGSVIEVATWRGTGRPDSRTNRLMMGMNSGNPQVNENNAGSKDSNQAKQSPDQLKDKVVFVAKSLLSKTTELINKASVTFKNRKPIATKIEPADTQNASALASASEVDEWLRKVLEKSEKKVAKAKQAKTVSAKTSAPVKKKAPAKKIKNKG